MNHRDTIPGSLLDPDNEDEIEVVFDWTPGTGPTGLSGPPENYDPGSDDEFIVISPTGLTDEQEERIVEHLDANWDRPVPDDEPDWSRDLDFDE